MKIPSPTQGQTKPSARGMDYLRAAVPDFSALERGLNSFGASIEARSKAAAAEKDQLTKFKALTDFNNFQLGATDLMTGLKKQSDPATGNFPEVADSEFTNYGNKFIETLPPELQDEFRVRVSETGQQFGLDARKFSEDQTHEYYKVGIDNTASKSKVALESNPNSLESEKARVDELIDNSSWSQIQKDEAKRENARQLEGITYRKQVEDHKLKTQGGTSDLTNAIKRGAVELGINPLDLATVISYETGGKFSTSIRGGAGNKYIGLIQFGPAEQAKYGARPGQTFDQQMNAVVAYLKDRGFKPGMSMLDLYSTINAGSPGRYNASDANNGGAPGSVADKVAGMGDHQKKAAALLGGTFDVPDNIDNDPRFANVPYEDRVALRKQAETNASSIIAEQQAQQKAQSAAFMNNFKVGVFDGTLGQKDLDEARQLGYVTDFEDIRTMQGIIDKRNADGGDLRNATEKLSSGGLWDLNNPDDKKGMNALFGESGDKALSSGDQNYYDTVLKPLSKSANMIPPNAIGRLDSMARNMNPKLAAFGLNALSDLHNNLPDAYERQVPEDVQKNVDFWEMRKSLPIDEKQVFDIIAGRMTPEQRNAREQLLKEADTFLTDSKNPSYTTFDSVLKAMGPQGWFDSNAQAPVWASARIAMQDEWKTLLKENYAKTGDWSAAQTASIKQLGRTWGTTDFGGRTTLMKYPPEKVGYRPIDGSMKWTEDQTRSELHISPDTPIQLISDDATMSQFQDTQKWEQQGYGPNVFSGAFHVLQTPTPPSYLVAVQGPDGWQLATNTDGAIIRQHFEVTPALKAQQEQSFRLKQQEEDLKQDFLRLDEANNMSRVTGIPVPKELIDNYNTKRIAVDKAKSDMTPKVQGPGLGKKQSAEGLNVLKLLGTQPKPQVVVPGVDVKTLEGYPPPALGMLNSGNIDLINRPVVTFGKNEKGTVRSISIEENGATILIPTIIDGKLVSNNEAIRHYQMTGEHLGIFADENSAEEYAKKLSSMQGKRLGL